MDPMPLFSVLIANYNNGHFITEAILSIKRQIYTNWEIIIVDDASTDSSVEIIEKFLNDQIRLYRNAKNEGCGYTKKRCVELANGEICGFLDPDDALTTNALSMMVDKHLEDEGYSLVYSNCYHCDENFNNSKLSKNNPIEDGQTYLGLAYEYQTIGHFATFKRKLYNNTSKINPLLKRAVDQDLYYKCEEVGTLAYINEALYYYRFHSGSISLFDNHTKAISWHINVAMDACKRREIPFEEIISKMLYNIFIKSSRKTVQYKIGNFLIIPLKYIHKLWRN